MIETNDIFERQNQLDWLHSRYMAPGWSEQPPPGLDRLPPDLEQIQLALRYIPPDEYETWIRTGMALKAGGCEIDIWNQWSATSDKYDADEIERKWNGFRGTGLGLGTVFFLAKEHGYVHKADDGDSEERRSRETQAARLLRLVESDDSVTVFKIPTGEAFVEFLRQTPAGLKVAETVPLNSDQFATFLRKRYRDAYDNLCGPDSINTVISYLAGDAEAAPAVFIRVAHSGGKVIVDLADEQRRVVEITAAGWRVISSEFCPVHFWRSPGMLALPMPERGGDLSGLSNYMNLSSNGKSDSALLERVILYLVSTFVDGPLLILEIVGEKGSAKTTQAKIIRKILDPNEADMMSPPGEDRDLALACRNQWAMVLDNVGSISANRSDLHCRISTGGAWRERQLHTNSGEFMYKFRRPQIITAIKDVITKPDLADRKLKLKLEQIPNDKRRPEKRILSELEIELPRIVGALFDVIAGALREFPSINAKELPRMADAAEFLLAAEKHLNWPEGTVATIFAQEAQSDAEDVLDAHPFIVALIDLVKDKGGFYQATATETLDALAAQQPSGTLPSGWPRTGKALKDRLKELAPELRLLGFEYSQEKNGKRRYLFQYSPLSA